MNQFDHDLGHAWYCTMLEWVMRRRGLQSALFAVSAELGRRPTQHFGSEF